jgi:hemolysin activation/secretion protein
VSLKGRAIGQYSNQVLPPAEKFFLGGTEFNRGYYSGEVTGDSAFVWLLELQFNTSYDFQAFDRNFNIAAQFYAFYDRGEAWQNNHDPYQRLSSMGLGLRMNVTRYTEFDIEGVHRNTRRVDGVNASPLKADAAYWRVITRF